MLPDTPTRRSFYRHAAAALCLALPALAFLSSCAAPQQEACLESHTVTRYHPTEVFLGGGAGYTHEYVASAETECLRSSPSNAQAHRPTPAPIPAAPNAPPA
jgi:hypothetical protein